MNLDLSEMWHFYCSFVIRNLNLEILHIDMEYD
jgi:hypothetical protein